MPTQCIHMAWLCQTQISLHSYILFLLVVVFACLLFFEGGLFLKRLHMCIYYVPTLYICIMYMSVPIWCWVKLIFLHLYVLPLWRGISSILSNHPVTGLNTKYLLFFFQHNSRVALSKYAWNLEEAIESPFSSWHDCPVLFFLSNQSLAYYCQFCFKLALWLYS